MINHIARILGCSKSNDALRDYAHSICWAGVKSLAKDVALQNILGTHGEDPENASPSCRSEDWTNVSAPDAAELY